MPETDQWLTHYEEVHRDIRNPAVFWLAVPILVVGTVGLLWSLPVPQALVDISPFLNWGTAFLMSAAVYYFIISVPLAIGMLPFVVGVAVIEIWLQRSGLLPWPTAILLTAAGVTGLAAGHLHRGGLPAVLRDIQLMMIGPMWLLSVLYRRLGIPH